AVKACMEIGTFCMLSVRRCAVTVISSRTPALTSAFSLAGAAADAAEDTALKMAATAYETFELIAQPPWNFFWAPGARPGPAPRPSNWNLRLRLLQTD